MTQEVERYQDRAPAEISDREWSQMERVAKMLAGSQLVPKQFQDKPDDIMIVGLAARDLGVQLSPNTLKHFYVIDQQVNLSAQLQIAQAGKHGHDVWFEDDECNDQQAVICVQRRGSQRIQRFTYTIAMARKAGLLDEWVEKWNTTQNGKRWAERRVVRIDGERVSGQFPDWVAKAVESGQVKRKDPWFKSREQMLMNRAATLAIGKAIPEVLLGVANLDFADVDIAPPADVRRGRPNGHRPAQPDEDIAEAELVDESEVGGSDPGGAPIDQPADSPGGQPAGDTAAAADTSGAEPDAAEDDPFDAASTTVGSKWVQRFAIACREVATVHSWDPDDLRHAIVAKATGGRAESSKDVLVGEVERVKRTFVDVRDGRLKLGYEQDAAVLVTVRYDSADELPF